MKNILMWAITVSIAGFLFGFDTAVISGADLRLQALWNTSPLTHGLLVMSSALWGTVVGALFGGIPCDRLGRKNTLIIIGVLYVVSAIGSALANDPYVFSLLRFIGGVGIGISSIVVPAYVAEIAPAKYRGRLVATYQFQIVFGILAAFLSNYLISGSSENDWRFMLGVVAIPSAIFLLLVFAVPESPRWLLLEKNNVQAARNIFIKMGDSPQAADAAIAEINAARSSDPHEPLLQKKYLMPIMLAFLIASFNQLSGINFIIYFAPRIFSLAGLDAASSLLSSAGVGTINLIFTMIGLALIDKLGRKTLMLIGSIGYLISLSVITWAFYTGAGGMVVVFFVFAFIAAHAIGQGAVIWVFIAEIFPNSVRAKGQSLGASTHWIYAALITLLIPSFLSSYEPHNIFGFFTLMMLLQLAFVIWMMPETKGRTLESITHKFH
ncbi:sugar transporter [Cellvibrio sp. BR]|uniref:sugar porter family MFS transporter n=1 Tax=Cellvibrio sp. BR TaxID=1134474 RepID=UPI0002600B27|nr:sugar porter family MFS transporter [Cellvibrio sp. BR]EIK42949.1 sugar transporter [Cellvibrio sp. BR]